MSDISKLNDKALGDEIKRRVAEGNGKLTLIGTGTFKMTEKAARVARNPRTGEAVNVPAKTVLTFKASKQGVSHR